MKDYLNNYNIYTKNLVYNFRIGDGGIGDCIKFFLYALNLCIKHNIRLFYLTNNTYLEKYLKLCHTKMYITKEQLLSQRIISENEISSISSNIYNIVTPQTFYDSFMRDSSSINRIFMPAKDVFYFSDHVISNSNKILGIKNYISVHLRLGDSFLETDKYYVQCKTDKRIFDEIKLHKFIKENTDIVFFCDNKDYKLKIKNLYPHVTITDSNIGHTSLTNTTDAQVLDAITDFYLIAHSKKIIAVSNYSGFSELASKFGGVELQKLAKINI